jgi:hypothetical protein
MKAHMGGEVFLHSFLISQLDGVIGQLNAQAGLQPVIILRYALRRGWARVGTFWRIWRRDGIFPCRESNCGLSDV